MYISRDLESEIQKYLQTFPAVALLGPRQCGKSTLARKVVEQYPGAIFLDLEDESDLQKLEDVPLFFTQNKGVLICIDEIQLRPDLFPMLRTILDKHKRNGQVLMLGSASRDLIRQSSESLAGRIGYLELTPFLQSELKERDTFNIWLQGGYPRSILADSPESSFIWRREFIKTYLERDIPQLGFNIPAQTLKRLWTMIAHISGQILNSSRLGESLGVSHTTLRSYVDLLTQTFMVRVLEPLEVNIKKRLVKSPKVYIRDTGILHCLLGIENTNDLMGHPIYGNSWESFVVEQICAQMTGWDAAFYRTSAGAEMDMVLSKGSKRIGVEIKVSSAPKVTKGFWNAFEDLGLEKAWIIAPVESSYAIHEKVKVANIREFIQDVI